MTKSFLVSGILMLLFVSVRSGLSYTVIDSPKFVKSFIPYILESTTDYYKTNPAFDDMADNDTQFEHLGLINNTYTSLVYNIAEISEYNFDVLTSIISVKIVNPGKYEALSNYVYNYMIVPITGSVIIKGVIKEITMKIWIGDDPFGKKFAAKLIDLKANFSFSNLVMDSNSSIIRYFKIPQYIERVFLKNIDYLRASFARAIDKIVTERLPALYPKSQLWSFTTFNKTFQKIVDNIYYHGDVTKKGEIIVHYNESSKSNMKKNNEEGFLRKLSIGMELFRSIFDEGLEKTEFHLNDANLPENFQNRLDIRTFQKIMPDAALRSITRNGTVGNFVNLAVAPLGKLSYKMKDQEVIGKFVCNFTNQKQPFVSAVATVVLKIETTWKKGDGTSTLCLDMKKMNISDLVIDSKTYPVLKAKFKEYLTLLLDYLFAPFKDKGVIDGGIQILDNLKYYNNSNVRWDSDEDAITIELS